MLRPFAFKLLRPRLVMRSEASKPLTLKLYKIGLLGAAKQATSDSMALAVPEGDLCLSSFKNKACSPEGAKRLYTTGLSAQRSKQGCADPKGTCPLTRRGRHGTDEYHANTSPICQGLPPL